MEVGGEKDEKRGECRTGKSGRMCNDRSVSDKAGKRDIQKGIEVCIGVDP